jgi:RND family efflux transporter MFP subunit
MPPTLHAPSSARALVAALALPLILFRCGQAPPAASAPPPPAVSVALPVQREVIEWDTYNGYLEATDSVKIVARVSGLITSAPFAEGSIVAKSQVLFTIDDRPFKADLDTKIAEQSKAKSQLEIANITFKRLEGVRDSRAISKQDVDNAKALRDQAAATLAAATAAVEAARLNVEWCQVTSPIDGRVSDKRVTVGNFVNGGAGQATILTTVQSVDPMYCIVDVDERSVLKYQQLAVEAKRVHEREGRVPCYVRLGNEAGFQHCGRIDFVDNRLDPNTGTIRARGVLENPQGLLTPGFFASMRIPGSGRYPTLLVPDTAIGNDQNQRTVLVVNKDNIVEVRPVQVGALFGELRSITSGLKPDDRVIVNGQLHARPGTPVTPTDVAVQVDPAAFADPTPLNPPPPAPGSAAPTPPAAPAALPTSGGAP